MQPELVEIAQAAKGFMPDEEGIALYDAALQVGERGPMLEIGSYCGKSAIYLGAAAKETNSVVYSIDHHRGSEENQPGQTYHDPDLVDEDGRVDSLPWFRSTIEEAGLARWVVGVVGESATVAKGWSTPLALVFIDGGHTQAAADADLELWAPRLVPGGLLAIHDVFPELADGGRPPFVIFERALARGFEPVAERGSLRVLRRSG